MRRFWSETRWILLGLAWVAGLVFGYLGFLLYSLDTGEGWSAGDIIYRTLQLLTMGSGAVTGRVNWMLETARFLLPALTVYTAFQGMVHLFREQAQWLRLWGLRDHVVICGLGRKGSRLAKELLGLGRKVVVIEKEPDHENVAILRQQGAVVLIGDATNRDVLLSARLLRARNLVSLLGEDNHNLQAAYQAYQLTRKRRAGKLTCIIHIASTDFLNLMRSSELYREPGVPFELETFDPYARAARLLLQEDPGWQETANTQDNAGHLLVIGLGRLGENMVVQAGYNRRRHHRQDRLHITVVDRDAIEKTSSLLRKYPQLSKVCDLIPLQADLSSVGSLQDALAGASGDSLIQRIYICPGDPVLSLQVCLNLLQIPELDPGTIWVRMAEETGIADLLKKPLPGLGHVGRVKTFDLYECACSAALLVGGPHELLAHDLHEIYRSEAENASTRLPWEQLPEDLKEANRQQASRIHLLLEAAGYRINPLQDWDAAERSIPPEEVEAMARHEHNLWLQTKQAGGWRFSSQRDGVQRTHPDLVSWDGLPMVEREKNYAAIRRLPALLARLGFQIDKAVE